MSTSLAMDHPSILSDAGDSSSSNDPFLSPPSVLSGHRFSHFDKQLFALGPSTSPEQAKRALEAHLAETERRIQEASNLGTTLLQQRKDLGERLKEVEKQQSEGDITPELRQKLVDIEKEYNEVGRETARAFLPKSRVSSSEMGSSPFTDKRSASPSKFESQTTATASPSKFSVPNRKQRNQPSNRVHDIEFATEISTSLLAQVRHLQALLAEKEETLKTVALEKSRLEMEAEGFTQRLRSLDESENRYKDENWNLETQIHEHLATLKEASEREKRLTQSLSLLQAEKNATQKELDEIKLNHAKLEDQHTSTVKHLDVELGTAKRSMTIFETEKGALQKKVEELMGQNQELARAVAHHRGRVEEREASQGSGEEEPQSTTDNNTPEHSPPPSPIKMTPRHSMLESETLKSSLHHAHRMIQSLKGNIHREKTEKLELKRMLQEARDEIEVARRGEPQVDSPGPRRARKNTLIQAKKPFKVGQLGGIRNSRSEVLIQEDQEDHFEDINWEDDHEQPSPSRGSRSIGAAAGAAIAASMTAGVAKSSHNLFGSSTEQSDAFETANERATETEDFQTGVEDMTGADDTDTETEKGGTIRAKPSRQSIALSRAGNRDSFQSTASTSEDEYMYEDAKTPGIHPQRLRLKVSRNGNRRSRVTSEDAQEQSPIEFIDSNKGAPQPARQSLFAELGELGSDDESVASGTPSRYASRGNTPQSSRPSTARNVTAPVIVPPVPRIPMIDSAMMTEPWEPEPRTPTTDVPILSGLTGAALGAAGGVATALGFNAEHDRAVSPEPHAEPQVAQPVADATNNEPLVKESLSIVSLPHGEPQISEIAPEAEATRSIPAQETYPVSSQYPGRPPMSDAASQWHEEQMKQQMEGLLKIQPQHDSIRPVSTTYSDMSSQYDNELIDEKLDKFPSPPISRNNTSMNILSTAETAAPVIPLTMSTIRSEHIEAEPIPEVEPISAAPLTISTIHSERIEQVDAEAIAIEPLTISTIRSEHLEPVIIDEARSESPVLPAVLPSTPNHSSKLDYFSISPGLGFSTIQSVDTEPIAPPTPRSPKRNGVMLPRFPATESKSVNEDKLEATYPITENRSIEEVKPEESRSKDEPHTPKTGFISSVLGGWNRKQASTPIIAEDETSQTPSRSPVAETPESQRPFKVVSGNASERSPKKPRVEMTDESSQTIVTAEQIDQMLYKSKRQEAILAEDGQKSSVHSPPHSTNIPAALKIRKSQESIGSVGRSKSKSFDSESSPVDVMGARRPTSSGSGRNASISSIHPPLPSDHRQVIAAAAQRSGSASGSGDHKHLTTLNEGQQQQQQQQQQPQRTGTATSSGTGTMGPPPVPSSYKNRPKTPSSQTHGSLKVISTSKYRNHSTERDVHSPTGTGRSRHSSVSSFASEVDTRFNLRAGIPMPQGVEPSTDPRMINAITQTMIGEYLWKYTRKAGRGGMSENRHRRYFWVHPYTRTLYWSDRDPSTAGRSELKAKSVAIEAVRVVTDDNPMPPGLHRKSLVILTPGRTVQFTASTGQRHETWFNALSYLLLRTGEDAVADTEQVSGALTSEDVDEFNPGYGHAHLGSRHGPPSLSSYNSRTTRNDSPISKDRRYSTMHPRLTSRPSRPSLGSQTFSRLSNYLLPGDGSRTFSGRRSRSVNGAPSIYEASEVHDSAEDLREQIERQDRESDRLENVRACCDGKHDVGHLHHETPKGRQTMSAASGSYRQTHRAPSRTSQRPSEPSQQT